MIEISSLIPSSIYPFFRMGCIHLYSIVILERPNDMYHPILFYILIQQVC